VTRTNDDALLRRSARGEALISVHATAVGDSVLDLEHYSIAMRTGAEYVEVDVRRTADDVLVAHHDPVVEGRPLHRMAFAELTTLAAGIPRLADIVELVKGRVRLHVDIKDVAVERPLLSLLRNSLGIDRFIVTSLDDDVIATVKDLWPEARAGLSLGRDHPAPLLRTRLSELRPLRRVNRCGADFLAVHHRLAQLGVLGQAARRGIPVFVWTVNRPEHLSRMLADGRVAGIVTDVPALAVALRRDNAAG
jgi:glycerophosphoryl diester phosphodiesterase